MLCQAQSLVKDGDRWGVAIPLYCRSWGCETCQPKRARQLICRGIRGKPNRLITLTSSSKSGETVEERAAALANAWRVTVRKARRLWPGQPIEYLAVFERTQRGEPHLHILVRGPFIPQGWLSGQMRERIGAPIVDIRLIREPEKAASYVAKYIGKDPTRFGSCKRYWATPGFDIEPAIDDDPIFDWIDWGRDDRSIHAIHHSWLCLGRKLHSSKKSKIVAYGELPRKVAAWFTDRSRAPP